MARYGYGYRGGGGPEGGYDMQYGNRRGYIAQSRGFIGAPFGRGYDVDLGAADARSRQLREELRFQRERAAPGEELEWERGRGPRRWEPEETPVAGDLMTEDPEAVTPDTSLADVAKRMRDLDVGIIPVVDDLKSRRLRGVITDRDITVRAIAEGKQGTAKVKDCMTTEVESCHPDDRVREVLHLMERNQVRRVPITDHAGALVGIIAQADLAVDYAERAPNRRARVEQTIERISEPARPRRGGR